jgi:hypothetical protein
MRRIIVFLISIILVQCRDNVNIEDVGECAALSQPSTSYSIYVYPIVSKVCAIPDCHTTGFEYGNYNKFDEFREKASNGKLLFMIERHQMPHGFTKGPQYLTTCEIETIKKWINEGALNN